MPWICYVTLQDDEPELGLARCVWDEAGPDQFTYTERALVKASEMQGIKDRAVAARSVEAAKRTSEANKSATLTSFFNT
jgi:hypothetical protein